MCVLRDIDKKFVGFKKNMYLCKINLRSEQHLSIAQ